jgi:hypothetical protein
VTDRRCVPGTHPPTSDVAMTPKRPSLGLALLLCVLCSCSNQPSPIRGEEPDPKISSLATVTLPTSLTVTSDQLAGLNPVAVAQGNNLMVAIWLRPGRCAITLVDGPGSPNIMTVDPPGKGANAAPFPRWLPTQAQRAIGPTNTVETHTAAGDVALTCGAHGAAVLAPKPSGQTFAVDGAAGQKELPGSGSSANANLLIVAGPPSTVSAATS